MTVNALTALAGGDFVPPALLKKITDGFVAGIQDFAERHGIPVVHFERDQRKEDVARKHLTPFKGAEGVVMIGVAQKMAGGWRMYQEGPRRRQRTPRGGRAPRFRFYRGKVHVYFYILDRNFGLTF